MNITVALLILPGILICGLYISSTSTFAQSISSEFTVTTDKTTYVKGETATIRGKVAQVIPGESIRIDVYGPDGKAYFATTLNIPVNRDGTYCSCDWIGINLSTGLLSVGENTILATYDKETSRSSILVYEFYDPKNVNLSSDFSVTTDKTTYVKGETATIRGKVAQVIPGESIRIDVYGPDGKAYFATTLNIPVNRDGTYCSCDWIGINLSTGLLSVGENTILATYDKESVQIKVTITEQL